VIELNRGEKIALVLLIFLSLMLPFLMIESPLQIPSLILPLWLWYPGTIGIWFYSGKSLLQVFLACYGAGNIGIVSVYYGINLIEILLKRKIHNRFSGFQTFRIKKITDWLTGKKSLFLILFIFFLPLPWSDAIATAAMEIRKERYGIWYLFVVNLFHVFLIALAVYSGLNFFFK
jgi:hypothetical protein